VNRHSGYACAKRWTAPSPRPATPCTQISVIKAVSLAASDLCRNRFAQETTRPHPTPTRPPPDHLVRSTKHDHDGGRSHVSASAIPRPPSAAGVLVVIESEEAFALELALPLPLVVYSDIVVLIPDSNRDTIEESVSIEVEASLM
jgi:hypothetical protein